MGEESHEPAAHLPLEAIEFFSVFSRMEYALKNSGYLKSGMRAEADWNKFGRALGVQFFAELERAGEIAAFIRQPPKMQIVDNQKLDWKEMPAPKNTVELLEAVRRARNNLFHGGKSQAGPIEECARDSDLLRVALVVLKRALACEKSVFAAFADGYWWR